MEGGQAGREPQHGESKARALPADFWIGLSVIAAAAVLFIVACFVPLSASDSGEPPAAEPPSRPPEAEAPTAPAPDAPPDLETELWALPGVESILLPMEDGPLSSRSESTKPAGEEALPGLRRLVRRTHAPLDVLALAEALENAGEAALESSETVVPEKRPALRGKASDFFLEGLSELAPVLNAIDAVRQQRGLEGLDEENGDLYRNARFLSARLQLLRAVAIGEATDERNELLDKACAGFKDFIWDYEDWVQGYLAYAALGDAALERGDAEEAAEYYDVLFSIPDHSDFAPEQKPLRDRLRILAHFLVIRLRARTGDDVGALEKALELEREYPGCANPDSPDPHTGRRAILETVKSLASLGKRREAAEAAGLVASMGGPTMEHGLALLAGFEKDDPGLGMLVRTVRAEGLLQSGEYRQAADDFKEAIDAAKSQEDRRQFGTRLWCGLARAFTALGQRKNALEAYLEGDREAQLHLGGRRWPADIFERGARCSYSAFRILEEDVSRFRDKGASPPPGSERRLEEHRQRLVDLYRESEWVMGISHMTGRDRLARRDFRGAVEAFRSSDTRSAFYEASLAGTGQAFLMDALDAVRERKLAGSAGGPAASLLTPTVRDALQKGKSCLEFLRDRAEASPAKGEAIVLRPRVLAIARLLLAGMHALEGSWSEVSKALDGAAPPSEAPAEWKLTWSFLKVKALAGLGRAEDLEEAVWDLQKAPSVPLSSGSGSRKSFLLRRAFEMAAEFCERTAKESGGDAAMSDYYTERAAEYKTMAEEEKAEVQAPAPPGRRRFWESAIGIGGGAGGSFGGRFGGRRSLRLYGGGRHTESAVLSGLIWLKRHQNSSGMWSCRSFTLQCDRGVCGGAGTGEEFDIGVTALSLLAYLGSGHTHRHGKFKNTVKAGLRALIEQQSKDGCVGPHEGYGHWIYGHAIATQALSEACALTNMSPLLKKPAQRAVDFLISCQNPYLGWRYGKQPGENDSCVSGWAVQALNSARIAGLKVPKESFLGALRWFEKAYDSDTHRTGYTSRGDKAGLLPEAQGRFQSSEGPTAVATLCRILVLKQGPDRDEAVAGGQAVLEKNPPLWDVNAGTVDMHYWLWGSQAMFQLGGDSWKPWNDKLIEALVPNQRKDGCAMGSWDPAGAWGPAGGRVYATALNILALEVYYRYGRLLSGR